jgi:hypothetical protein
MPRLSFGAPMEVTAIEGPGQILLKHPLQFLFLHFILWHHNRQSYLDQYLFAHEASEHG